MNPELINTPDPNYVAIYTADEEAELRRMGAARMINLRAEQEVSCGFTKSDSYVRFKIRDSMRSPNGPQMHLINLFILMSTMQDPLPSTHPNNVVREGRLMLGNNYTVQQFKDLMVPIYEKVKESIFFWGIYISKQSPLLPGLLIYQGFDSKLDAESKLMMICMTCRYVLQSGRPNYCKCDNNDGDVGMYCGCCSMLYRSHNFFERHVIQCPQNPKNCSNLSYQNFFCCEMSDHVNDAYPICRIYGRYEHIEHQNLPCCQDTSAALEDTCCIMCLEDIGLMYSIRCRTCGMFSHRQCIRAALRKDVILTNICCHEEIDFAPSLYKQYYSRRLHVEPRMMGETYM